MRMMKVKLGVLYKHIYTHIYICMHNGCVCICACFIFTLNLVNQTCTKFNYLYFQGVMVKSRVQPHMLQNPEIHMCRWKEKLNSNFHNKKKKILSKLDLLQCSYAGMFHTVPGCICLHTNSQLPYAVCDNHLLRPPLEFFLPLSPAEIKIWTETTSAGRWKS